MNLPQVWAQEWGCDPRDSEKTMRPNVVDQARPPPTWQPFLERPLPRDECELHKLPARLGIWYRPGRIGAGSGQRDAWKIVPAQELLESGVPLVQLSDREIR